jgi:hypothetical protein
LGIGCSGWRRVMMYYNERWLTIRWDDSVKAVWTEYKGYAEGEEYRAGHEAGLKV